MNSKDSTWDSGTLVLCGSIGFTCVRLDRGGLGLGRVSTLEGQNCEFDFRYRLDFTCLKGF